LWNEEGGVVDIFFVSKRAAGLAGKKENYSKKMGKQKDTQLFNCQAGDSQSQGFPNKEEL